jgi:hypothetical protein
MNTEFQKALDLVEAAKRSAAGGDHFNAEILYQDAIAAFSKSNTQSKEHVAAFIGLADSIDARGGDSKALRAVAKAMASAYDDNA